MNLENINFGTVAYLSSLLGLIFSSYFAARSAIKMSVIDAIPFIVYILIFLVINAVSIELIDIVKLCR